MLRGIYRLRVVCRLGCAFDWRDSAHMAVLTAGCLPLGPCVGFPLVPVAWACILSEFCVVLVPQSKLRRILYLGCRVRLPLTVLHTLCLAFVWECILCALLADGSARTPRTAGG